MKILWSFTTAHSFTDKNSDPQNPCSFFLHTCIPSNACATPDSHQSYLNYFTGSCFLNSDPSLSFILPIYQSTRQIFLNHHLHFIFQKHTNLHNISFGDASQPAMKPLKRFLGLKYFQLSSIPAYPSPAAIDTGQFISNICTFAHYFFGLKHLFLLLYNSFLPSKPQLNTVSFMRFIIRTLEQPLMNFLSMNHL